MHSTAPTRSAIKTFALSILISILVGGGIGVGLYHVSAIPLALGGGVLYFLYLSKNDARSEKVLHITALGTILLCAVWPRYAAFFLPGLPLINPQRIANTVLVTTIFLSIFTSRQFREKIYSSYNEHRTFFYFLAAYLLTRVLSVLFSDEPSASAYRFIQEVIVHTVFILAGIHFAEDERKLHSLIKILVFGSIIAASASLAEYALQRNLFSYFITPQNDYMAWALSDQFRDGKFRAKGTFDHPLTLAEYSSLAVGLGVLFLYNSKSATNKYLAAPALVGTGVLTVLASGSRSGYVAMGLVIGLVFTLPALATIARKELTLQRAAFWSIAIIFLGAFLALTAITIFDYSLGKHAYNDSDAMRAQMFERTIQLAKESPLWGHGIGLAPETIGVMTQRTRVYTVDSFFMTVSVESGLVALLSLFGMLTYSTLASLKKSILYKSDEWLVWIGVAIALIICITFKSILSLLDNNHLMFLLLGLPLALKSSKSEHA